MSTEGNIVSEITGQLVSAPSFPACLSCVSEYILANNNWVSSGQPDGEGPVYEAMVEPAVTPMEKAAASGILVPSPQNGRGM
jgi:hypothetical protein